MPEASQDYVIADQEPSIDARARGQGNHHAGGSFGNLDDFERDQQAQLIARSKQFADRVEQREPTSGILQNASPAKHQYQSRESEENSSFMRIERMIQNQESNRKLEDNHSNNGPNH